MFCQVRSGAEESLTWDCRYGFELEYECEFHIQTQERLAKHFVCKLESSRVLF